MTPQSPPSLGIARWLRAVGIAAAVSTGALQASDPADGGKGVALTVVEPFVDVHSGPGRGYPVFQVLEQGEIVRVLKRRTNWYKVRGEDFGEGWVQSALIAHSIEPSGIPADLPEIGHGDYLKSRWRAGFTTGQFEGAAAFSLLLGFRPLAHLGLEAEYGEIFDDSATGSYYGGTLIVEPMPSWVVTPFASIGFGKMSFERRQKLAGEEIDDANYRSLGAGVHYYIGRNFVLRGEYKWYSVSAANSDSDLNEWRVGFNAFF